VSRARWFVLGAATGVYAVVRAKRAAWSLTPDGLTARAAAAAAALRALRDQVGGDMAVREAELTERLALPAADRVPSLIEPPTDQPAAPGGTPRHRREDDTDGHR
jgi:hypothetical protein